MQPVWQAAAATALSVLVLPVVLVEAHHQLAQGQG